MYKNLIKNLGGKFPVDFLMEFNNIRGEVITDLPPEQAILTAYNNDATIFCQDRNYVEMLLVSCGHNMTAELRSIENDLFSWYAYTKLASHNFDVTFISSLDYISFITNYQIILNVGGKLLIYKLDNFDAWLSTCPYNLLINKKDYFMVEIPKVDKKEDLFEGIDEEFIK